LRITVLALAFVLTGCAATPFTSPDGRRGFAAECDRGFQSMADCHRMAREGCGGDYDVLASRDGHLEVACKS